MRKFEFQSTTEDVEIAGKVYKLDFADEMIKKYKVLIREITGVTETIKAEHDEITQFEKSYEVVEKFVDYLLGEGACKELYEESGKSVLSMIDLLHFLVDIVIERYDGLHSKRVEKYSKLKNNVTGTVDTKA